MNAFANAACSSIPVATARTFGSSTTSSGANPASPTSRSYARPRISTFRSTVSACPRSSNAMTTAAAPNARIVRACSRNGSSPSLSEMEFTTPLPWRQRNPASSAEKRELSTMIGRRAASGSVARRLRNVVIACLCVEQVGVHVHVEQVRAATHLLERDVDRALKVVRLDQSPELRRAGHVRPLSDDDEPGVGPDDERLEAREARQARALGHPPRRKALDGANDRVRVLGRRPATAPDEVHETVLGERAQVPARIGGLLVVEAEGVRQARVGMARHVGRRDARHPFEEGPHLGRAERAVDADDERLGVLDRDPERVRRLAREVASAPVDRREREPERELGRSRARSDDRRLRVERVEDRLDQQEVDAAVAQCADLLLVRGLHLVERHRTVGGVLDLGREGERDVQRADRAGDEARLVGRSRRPGVGGRAREPCAGEAHLRRGAPERVVGLPDRGRGEGVRRRDVRAGLEVRVVDLGDDLRRGQVEDVRVALDVMGVRGEPLAAVLLLREPAPMDEHAPRPVEHEDPLGEEISELCRGCPSRRSAPA